MLPKHDFYLFLIYLFFKVLFFFKLSQYPCTFRLVVFSSSLSKTKSLFLLLFIYSYYLIIIGFFSMLSVCDTTRTTLFASLSLSNEYKQRRRKILSYSILLHNSHHLHHHFRNHYSFV